MTFGITPQGFNRMLESDLRAEMVADLAPLFDVDPNTVDWPSTDSPVSQLLEPFNRRLGIVWELLEAAFQAIDPSESFGTLLDGLLFLNNLSRLEATQTEVLAALSGTEGTVVPATNRLSTLGVAALFQAAAQATITKAVLLRANVQVLNNSNPGTPFTVTINGHVVSSGSLGGSPTRDSIAYLVLAAINASVTVNDDVQAAFYGTATLQILTVANSTTYTVTLNGVAYSYVSDASATNVEIRDNLITLINTAGLFAAAPLTSTTFSVAPAVAGADWVLLLTANLGVATLTPTGAMAIKSQNLKTPFSLDMDARMGFDKLFSPQTYLAVATGPVEAPAGTLITLETPQSGLQAATNFLDGQLGRNVEEDDAARVRRQETLSTGSSQAAAILSALRKVLGVTVARVYENIQDNPDAEGRPGHSVEALVLGGADAEVAQVVWDSRAAGIKPYGNIDADGGVDPDGSGEGIVVQDSNGLDQTVHFSRPETRYAFVHAILTLYSEEIFPGTDAVRDAILEFGNTVGIGKDFLLQRFIGPCVNVPGVGRVDLRIAVSSDPDNAPAGFPSTPSAATWQVDVPVGTRQVLVFDSSRITVV